MMTWDEIEVGRKYKVCFERKALNRCPKWPGSYCCDLKCLSHFGIRYNLIKELHGRVVTASFIVLRGYRDYKTVKIKEYGVDLLPRHLTCRYKEIVPLEECGVVAQ